jgi:hypothetical protein
MTASRPSSPASGTSATAIASYPAGLKTLPPGSVYSEPGGAQHNHFARTEADDVIVQISGYGPTDTRYVEAKNDPAAKKGR